MGKLNKNSKDARKLFGEFIFDRRRGMKIGTYGIARAIGVTHTAIHDWEIGHSFPNSIIALQKMEVAYGGISNFLQELLDDRLAVTDKDREDFLSELQDISGARGFWVKDDLIQGCTYKDERKREYSRKFGAYIRSKRLSMGIKLSSLSKLLGESPNNISRWESGSCMPRNIDSFQKLNLMTGDLIPVMFGYCRDYPILISREERALVKELMEVEHERVKGKTRIGGPKPKSKGL